MKMRLLSFLIICSITNLNAQSFTNIAQAAGITHTYGSGQFGGGVSFCDFNGDGLDDLTFATQEGQSVKFFENNSGSFSQVTLPGINTLMEQKSVLWIDFDNDGDQDFHVTGFAGQFLFKNQNGVFQNITESAGLGVPPADYYGASWGDLNRDGLLDFFLCNRGGPNRLYLNSGNGHFTEIAESAGVPINNKLSFCVALLDINNDGWTDIYIAEDKTGANTLLKNLGDSGGSIQFEDISTPSGANIIIDAMNTGFGDFNNDGLLDIYVTNTTAGNKLLRNEGNETFFECADEYGVGFYDVCWGGNFFDFDNDMDLDLHVCSISSLTGPHAAPNYLYENTGDTFLISTAISYDTSRSFSNAIGDFNGDGLPDIAINNELPDSAGLFLNNTSENNWIKINLQGVISNRDGVGSWIEIYTGALKQVRFTHAGIGYLAQNAHAEHFGLAQNEVLDSIRVLWPSGVIDKLENIGVNQELVIVEGGSTSINDLKASISKIMVYPNPASNRVSLDLSSEKDGEVLMRILSTNGKELLSTLLHLTTGGNHFQQDISILNAGVYLIVIEEESTVLFNQKIVVAD